METITEAPYVLIFVLFISALLLLLGWKQKKGLERKYEVGKKGDDIYDLSLLPTVKQAGAGHKKEDKVRNDPNPSLVSVRKSIHFDEYRVEKRFYRAGSSFPGYADLVGNTAEEKFCDFFARVLMIGFDREQMRAIILTYSMAEELIWPHYRHEADGFAHSYYGYKPSFSDQGMRVVIARLVKEGWLSADVLSQEPGTLVPAT